MESLPLASCPKHIPDGVGDCPLGGSGPAAFRAYSLPWLGQVFLEFPPQWPRHPEVVHFRRCGSLSHKAHLLSRMVMVAIPFSERCVFVQGSQGSSRIESYPHEYPEDPELCKNHLKALRKRLQWNFGTFAAFWRMGIQERGAWHFHLLLFAGSSLGSIGKLRRFISSSWYEVTGKVSEGHLRAGTRVEAVKKWKQATSYVERYMAKPEEFPEGLQTGRIWGVWNKELLPIRWETAEVSLRDAFRIRRIYRKLAKRKGSGSLLNITVFVRCENVVGLLRFLGYCLE